MQLRRVIHSLRRRRSRGHCPTLRHSSAKPMESCNAFDDPIENVTNADHENRIERTRISDHPEKLCSRWSQRRWRKNATFRSSAAKFAPLLNYTRVRQGFAKGIKRGKGVSSGKYNERVTRNADKTLSSQEFQSRAN